MLYGQAHTRPPKTSRKSPSTHEQKTGLAQSSTGRFGEEKDSLPPPGLETRPVQPLA